MSDNTPATEKVADTIQPGDWQGFTPTPIAAQTYRKLGTAYILLFFFGLIGVHRFYAGSIGLGIAYIFTFGFFGIGILVDLFTLGSTIEKENVRRGFTTTVSYSVR